MSAPKMVTEMFAFVVDDEPGGQGIPSITDLFGRVLPFVGSDMERVEILRPAAVRAAKEVGYRLHLMRFKLVSDEVIYKP